MWKKVLKALLAIILANVIAAGFCYLLNKERWEAEYAAFCPTAAPILMYHGVGEEPPYKGKPWPKSLLLPAPLFEEQLRYLKEEGWQLVTVAELCRRLEAGEPVAKYAALSFDDGYKNNYRVVLPLLQKYDAKATFFVINKDIGDPIHMDEGEIKALIAAGMELGSHSYSHNPLADIDPQYLVWETDTSRYWLKKKFDGYIVRSLSYPNGSYNQEVIEVARRWGFYRAVTGHLGVNSQASYQAAPMELYRVTIRDDGKGLEGFKQRLRQAYLAGFLQTWGLDVNPLRELVE